MPMPTDKQVFDFVAGVLAADVESADPGGPCHFCNRPTTTDDHCQGCGKQVCTECFGSVLGPHEAVEHVRRPGAELS